MKSIYCKFAFRLLPENKSRFHIKMHNEATNESKIRKNYKPKFSLTTERSQRNYFSSNVAGEEALKWRREEAKCFHRYMSEPLTLFWSLWIFRGIRKSNSECLANILINSFLVHSFVSLTSALAYLKLEGYLNFNCPFRMPIKFNFWFYESTNCCWSNKERSLKDFRLEPTFYCSEVGKS